MQFRGQNAIARKDTFVSTTISLVINWSCIDIKGYHCVCHCFLCTKINFLPDSPNASVVKFPLYKVETFLSLNTLYLQTRPDFYMLLIVTAVLLSGPAHEASREEQKMMNKNHLFWVSAWSSHSVCAQSEHLRTSQHQESVKRPSWATMLAAPMQMRLAEYSMWCILSVHVREQSQCVQNKYTIHRSGVSWVHVYDYIRKRTKAMCKKMYTTPGSGSIVYI